MHHLLGTAEVAQLLGVSDQRVRQLERAYFDFPLPVATLRSGRVWSTEDIEGWLAAHSDRRSGRPRRRSADECLPRLGTHIRQYRMAKGMTQTELARRTGVRADYLERLEKGTLEPHDHAPTVDLLREIADSLGRHPAELMGLAGYHDDARLERAAHGRDGRHVARRIARELRSEVQPMDLA